MKGSKSNNWAKLSAIGICALALSPSAHAREGGISGGGGGSINAAPVTVDDVRGAVEHSRIAVAGWLNAEEILYRNYSQIPGSPKLFDSSPNILQILPEISIEFRTGSPCIDPVNGEAVDGSADLTKPRQICISGYNLAKKLDAFDLVFETEALIIHEISHLLGTNEDEAVAIQKKVIQNLQTSSVQNFEQNSIQFLFAVDAVQNSYQDLSAAVNCAAVGKAIEAAKSVRPYLVPLSSLSLLDWEDTIRFNELETRGQALQMYVCGNDPAVSAPDRAQDLSYYNYGFRPGETQIPVSLFENRENSHNLPASDDSVMITKLLNAQDAQGEGKSLHDIYVNIYVELMKRLNTSDFELHETL